MKKKTSQGPKLKEMSTPRAMVWDVADFSLPSTSVFHLKNPGVGYFYFSWVFSCRKIVTRKERSRDKC